MWKVSTLLEILEGLAAEGYRGADLAMAVYATAVVSTLLEILAVARRWRISSTRDGTFQPFLRF